MSLTRLVNTPRASSDWRPRSTSPWIDVGITVVGLLAIHLVFLAPAFRGDQVDASKAGLFGDFIGGYVGALLSLATLVIVRRSFAAQSNRWQLEAFEPKYFQLLSMHRENVHQLTLESSSGRRIFVLLIRELRGIHAIAKEIWASQHPNAPPPIPYLLTVSFVCLWYGVGPNSTRQLRAALLPLNNPGVKEADRLALFAGLVKALEDDKRKDSFRVKRNFPHVPFEGHDSRLGHYYRHLYQMVRYVDGQQGIPAATKQEFVKTIRAQLTSH